MISNLSLAEADKDAGRVFLSAFFLKKNKGPRQNFVFFANQIQPFFH